MIEKLDKGENEPGGRWTDIEIATLVLCAKGRQAPVDAVEQHLETSIYNIEHDAEPQGHNRIVEFRPAPCGRTRYLGGLFVQMQHPTVASSFSFDQIISHRNRKEDERSM